MSTNISKQKREDLLNKIKEIRTFISAAQQDENTGNLLSYLSDFQTIGRIRCMPEAHHYGKDNSPPVSSWASAKGLWKQLPCSLKTSIKA